VTVYHDKKWPDPLSRWFAMLAMVLLTSLVAQPTAAGAEEPYPEFVADYVVRMNGVKVGEATFTLRREGPDEYLYQQRSTSTGVAALMGADVTIQTSRWRYVNGEILTLEFLSERDKGDDDDNANLVFNWKRMRVANRGAGERWKIKMPEGTLDSLTMQMALMFDLRDGKTRMDYPVAVRGRIKHYLFEVTGRDTIELPFGNYDALRAERKDDEKDQSLVWSAPELDYFPVRFIKHKKAGVKVEILLQKLDLSPPLAKDTSG